MKTLFIQDRWGLFQNKRMCVLHVNSKTQSFKNFIDKTLLPIYQSHEIGEEIKIGLKGINKDYGFSCDVSKKPWTDFDGQLEDIRTFINKHRVDLISLKENYKDLGLRFDLPYELRIGEKYFTQTDYLPPDLLGLLAEFEIGLELTLYPPGK